MKKLGALLCAFSLLFSLAACSGDDTAGMESTDGNVVLRFAWWGNQERSDITMEIIEMYKEVAPHVTIEPEIYGWADYWTILSTQTGGAALPDIVQMRDPQLAQYVQSEKLANLDELIEHFNLEHVEDEILNAGRIEDGLYMIPTGINAMGFVYDPAMFQEANAMEPALDWTWEEFRESADAMHNELGIYGASQFEATSDLSFIQYLNSQGYELLAEDGNSLGFDDEQLLIDYFTMELEMTESGVIPGPDLYGQRLAWEESFMVAGEAPSISVFANNLGYLQALSEGRMLQLGPLPAGELGTEEALRISASMGFSIAESCVNKEEAMKFLDFFTNTTEVQELEMLERGIPISSAVRDEMLPNLDDLGQEVFSYIDFVSEHCEVASPLGEAAVPLSTIFVDINEQVLFKQLTPEQGADEYMRQAAEVFA